MTRLPASAEEAEKPNAAVKMAVVVAVDSAILRNIGLVLSFPANKKSADAHFYLDRTFATCDGRHSSVVGD